MRHVSHVLGQMLSDARDTYDQGEARRLYLELIGSATLTLTKSPEFGEVIDALLDAEARQDWSSFLSAIASGQRLVRSTQAAANRDIARQPSGSTQGPAPTPGASPQRREPSPDPQQPPDASRGARGENRAPDNDAVASPGALPFHDHAEWGNER